MNSCVLMAEIIQEPQLRYTADNLAVTEMLVQFPNPQRGEDQLVALKVVGWGNLATEIQQNYHQGDRVILAGRLGMQTVERQEGFKEKRAELTVQQIEPAGTSFSPTPAMTVTASVTSTTPQSSSPPKEVELPAPTAPTPIPENFEPTNYPPIPGPEPDSDDIPF
ncbi:single-stranded DNA-binding protein [Chrysosporum bergii ANA360D]|jgi:single-stranded DNA-binding protein|uniref:Single-stranded DNA-binding protein n=1 Tax=Chrysosporum bergii ANA360D TaxID=617107 RepID=A0AA43GU55_9CYAN|nr:single-stranded DNA-binding protein [Chrysosporum bergii]MDH6061701.1 single-stranded DNA-binding protein [Chrysosporum bergii ANA360D]